ncbi:hypothetical protein [Bradyrhizobium sp. CCH5-F6]|jgi:hypothetical protein|uniref:hypothetical protein n=1 Tax=Bradyrhizobium sp. CCH5-F6 TaxID=1768753 RepID=UPI00076A51B5|nr:hypothetical protein [Bradyrhizobium sp. CCH5-F6]
MKPFFMKFRQGKGDAERDVYVNMSQVCYIATDGANGSVLTFAAVLQDEPAYLCVNEAPDEIGARPEWRQ